LPARVGAAGRLASQLHQPRPACQLRVAQQRLEPGLTRSRCPTGPQICLDLLQDAWSPCHNVCSLLASIQSLLTDPEPNSAANPEAANQFLYDRRAYDRKVRRLAERSLE
jgi:hypothetical protein